MTDRQDRVHIVDTTLRDGIQHQAPLSTETKLRILEASLAAGIRSAEIGSFVNPARLPQFADVDEVCRASAHLPLTRITLVANARGVTRASEEQVTSLSVTGSRDALDAAVAAGHPVRAYLSTLSVDPWETEPEHTVAAAHDLVRLGAATIMIADERDHATTEQFDELLATLLSNGIPPNLIGIHLHEGHGRATDKVHRALERGVRHFDATIAGIGGNPHTIPRMEGNIAVRTLVDACRQQGIRTDVELTALAEAEALVLRTVKEQEARE